MIMRYKHYTVNTIILGQFPPLKSIKEMTVSVASVKLILCTNSLKKMKTVVFGVLLLPLLLVCSHPINMICIPVCSPNVTANETLVNHWLSNEDSTGIDQLLNHKGTIIRSLMNLLSTDVSIL